jgi:hypothetical protein
MMLKCQFRSSSAKNKITATNLATRSVFCLLDQGCSFSSNMLSKAQKEGRLLRIVGRISNKKKHDKRALLVAK